MERSPYFTDATIDEQVDAMLAELAPYVRSRGDACMPDHAALIVLDMQRYFLDASSHAYIPSAGAMLPRIAELIARCRRENIPVIATRHLDGPDPATPMRRWWRGRVIADDPMSAVVDEVGVTGAHIVVKHQYDAFHDTALEQMLRGMNIQSVIITGVLAHLCVESTARGAFMRGYDVIVPVDGTATYTRDLHLGALRGLAHGVAHVPRIESLVPSPIDAAQA